MTPELWSISWWLGGTSPFEILVGWVLASVSVQYLRFDAAVWGAAAMVFRSRFSTRSIKAFIAEGRDCDRCSLYWLTVPLLVLWGPVVWLGVNGVYLILSAHLPTLTEPDDEGGG